MIDSFLNFLQYEKRYSSHTLTSYECDLNEFHNYLQDTFEDLLIEKVSHSQLRDYVIFLSGKGLSNSSINRKISSLKSYYKFLVRNNSISENPAKALRSLKKKKRLPVFVEENDLNILFDQFHFEDSFSGKRDHIILLLLYSTGIRLSELISLTDNGLDLSKGEIKVLGKGNKQRIIPLTKEAIVKINSYILSRGSEFGAQPNSCFVVTNKNEQTYPMFIYRVVRKYLDQITTVDKRSPHVLRHSFATHLLNKGAELNAIKELLGHTSLAATEVYTHNSIDKLKAIFDQAHPRS